MRTKVHSLYGKRPKSPLYLQGLGYQGFQRGARWDDFPVELGLVAAKAWVNGWMVARARTEGGQAHEYIAAEAEGDCEQHADLDRQMDAAIAKDDLRDAFLGVEGPLWCQ